ncbi:MAG TPA: PAS domain S-box protein, partial [Candidatus Wallbacteria bacterium]|nr:PAS domain S-box protein [Candidatus Wallbacteria bacterium]
MVALYGFFFDDELQQRNEMFARAMDHGFDSQKFHELLMNSPVIKRIGSDTIIKKCAHLMTNLRRHLGQDLEIENLSGSGEKNLVEVIEKNLSAKNYLAVAEPAVISTQSPVSDKNYDYNAFSFLNLSEFYAFIIITSHGIVKRANECAMKMFDLSYTATIDHNLWDLLSEDISFKRKMFAAIALHDKRRQSFEEKIGGRYFETEICPGGCADGNEEILAIISREVTEVRKNEIKYLESQAKLKDIFENSLSCFLVVDFTELKKYIASIISTGIHDLKKYFSNHEKELEQCLKMFIIKDVNGAAVKLFKSKTKENLINNREKIFTFESKISFIEDIEGMISSNLPFENELYMQDFEGSKIAVNLKRNRLEPDNTSLIALTNITERKNLEKYLIGSLERYRAIFEFSVEGIALAEADTGILVDCNQSFLKLMEYEDKKELIGKHQKTLHPPENNTGDFTSGFEMRRRLAADEKPLKREIITKNGIIKEVKIITSTFDINGKKCLMGIFKDMTDEIKYAESLKDYESIIKGIHETISADVGERFFERLLNDLGNIIKADFVFIGKYIDNYSKISIVASTAEIPEELKILEADCEPCLENSGVSIIEDSDYLFPRALTIKHFNAKEYAGIPLFNSRKELVGVMSTYFSVPVENKKLLETLLNIFSIRVGSELERIEAENNIKKSEEKYRTFFYNSAVPMVEMNGAKLKERVDSLKRSGIELKSYYINNLVEFQGLLKLISVSKMNLNAKNYFGVNETSEFEPQLLSLFTEHTLNYLLDSIISIGSGKSETSSETIFKLKNGEERNIILNITKLPPGSPSDADILASFFDITERKKAEEALAFNNIILRTQQESSIDGILLVGEKGEILSCNQRFADMWDIPAGIIELKSDELAIQSVIDKLLNPEEFIRKVKYLYEVRDEICRDDIELKDGRTFDRYSAPILNSSGKYFGRVWYFRDITDRKQVEKI